MARAANILFPLLPPLCSPSRHHLLGVGGCRGGGSPLHSIPSSFSPHLPVFCAPPPLPPASLISVQPRPLFPLWPPFPLLCYPLTLPTPLLSTSPSTSPSTGTPKSSCSSLDRAPPLGFCWGANNCYQQDPHKIPA